MVADYLDPKWNEAQKCHDWKNHVGSVVRAIWHTFTDEQKRALAEDAQDRADGENWD